MGIFIARDRQDASWVVAFLVIYLSYHLSNPSFYLFISQYRHPVNDSLQDTRVTTWTKLETDERGRPCWLICHILNLGFFRVWVPDGPDYGAGSVPGTAHQTTEYRLFRSIQIILLTFYFLDAPDAGAVWTVLHYTGPTRDGQRVLLVR